MTKNTLIKNHSCINSIANTLITDLNLDPTIKEDLISEGKVALIECNEKSDFRTCVQMKMLQFIKKEKEYNEKKILGNTNCKNNEINPFLKGFNYLPKKTQGEVLEALIKGSEMDLETFENVFGTMVDTIAQRNPEVAEEIENNLEYVQDIISVKEKTRTRKRR